MSGIVTELANLAASKPGAPKASAITATWNGVTNWVAQTMQQGKGCALPNLGTFAFHSESLFLGTTGNLNKKVPLFKINSSFSASTGVKVRNTVTETAKIPSPALSFIAVASQTGLGRDVVELSYRLFVQTLTEEIAKGRTIPLDLGAAVINFTGHGNTTVKFKAGLSNEEKVGPTNKVDPSATLSSTTRSLTKAAAADRSASARSSARAQPRTDAAPRRPSSQGSQKSITSQKSARSVRSQAPGAAAFDMSSGYPMENTVGSAFSVSKAPTTSGSRRPTPPSTPPRGASGAVAGDQSPDWVAQKTHHMETSVLKDISAANTTLPPNVCAICKRKSKHLPFPNMCSLCHARRQQIEEKIERERRELAEDAKYQAFLREKDQTDLTSVSATTQATKAHRLEADLANQEMMERKRERQRALATGRVQSATALDRGFVGMGDVFQERRDVEEEEIRNGTLQARKTSYLNDLKKQIKAKEDTRRANRQAELEFGEKERALMKEKELQAIEQERRIKEEKDAQKRADMLRQMAQPRETIPAQFGYGPDGDVFTQQEGPEETHARKIQQQRTIQYALENQIKQANEKKQRQIEADRELGERERALEREEMAATAAEEVNARLRSQEAYRDALDKQTAARLRDRKQERQNEIAEERQMVNVFLKNEADAPEMKRRRLEAAKKTAAGLDQMVAERKKLSEAERQRNLAYGRMIREMDAQDLELEKQQSLERRKYTQEMKAQLQQQMAEKQQLRKQERESALATANQTSLNFAGEEEPDCEEIMTRHKPLTKQQKMEMGLL